jgi:signal transduction histidine kinase
LVESNSVKALNERLGFLAHELRNLIHTATLAVMAIKAGNVGATGATGALLDRSLIGMRNLIDRSLADVRVIAGMPPRARMISLADFVADVKISGSLEAHARQCEFTVGAVDAELALDVDREMLFSAVGNLLQNAFKFTQRHTDVSLNAYAAADRIRIDVEDHCGGLPPRAAKDMFRPFEQSGEDRSGLGLGLAICRRSVEANSGVLSVRDVAGSGCVFTIELPRHVLAQTSQV